MLVKQSLNVIFMHSSLENCKQKYVMQLKNSKRSRNVYICLEFLCISYFTVAAGIIPSPVTSTSEEDDNSLYI